jgi:peptide deformylase
MIKSINHNNDLFEKAVLKVINNGHPLLRQKARPVTNAEIISHNMKRLITFMYDTMTDYDGAGLAAPQVNIDQQIILIEYKKEYLKGIRRKVILERDIQEIPFQILFNPILTPTDNNKTVFFEGCLSVPDSRALVQRHLNVDVTALDIKGQPITIHATGWYARILQHEIDHLNGKLYIDRMFTRSFTTTEHYERLWIHKPIKKIRRELGV